MKPTKEITAALKEAGFEQLVEKTAKKYDMTGQILQMFSNAGFKIDSSSAIEINEIFDGNMKLVANEIEKLSMYFAYKKPQSSADIMHAITARKQDNIFNFIDFYTVRNKHACVVYMDKFLSSGENLAILTVLLFKRMRELYLYNNVKDAVTEKRPWIVEKIKAGAKSWPKKDLYNLLSLFADLDYKLKTGQVSQRDFFIAVISYL